jgi:hypothetical protein
VWKYGKGPPGEKISVNSIIPMIFLEIVTYRSYHERQGKKCNELNSYDVPGYLVYAPEVWIGNTDNLGIIMKKEDMQIL